MVSPPTAPDVSGVAGSLVTSVRALLETVPGAPHRPTALAQRLGLSRVTVSNLLGSLDRSDHFEVLEAVPGPESLRAVVAAAAALGVDPRLVAEARAAIDRFAALIPDHIGTRAALSAAIGGKSRTLRARLDQSGRADVFRGMRRILGVETGTWLTTMMFAPSPGHDDSVAVTTIHGALGMRRLRADTQVYYTCGAPYPDPQSQQGASYRPISLEEFYTHEAARVETSVVGGQLRHCLLHDRLGKHAVMDMLAASHNPRGSPRYGTPQSPLRGVSLFVDIPAQTLVCDAIVHKDIFPDGRPQLLVFNPGAKGPANPNDRDRDADRTSAGESPALVPENENRFLVPEVPKYTGIIDRVSSQLGYNMDDFRVFRLKLAYPVVCFQYVVAFEAPRLPAHG